MKYTIDLNRWDEGGSAEFYHIKEDKNLGFKQFRNKKSANAAYNKQKLLSKFDLAPKVYGRVHKIKIQIENFAGENYTYSDHIVTGKQIGRAHV